eukprot:TRINITY_DN4879_c0_g1_i4.p1 TRINITY_DN4879_c0_g1~~TRINITY_DN4879_c0_g1_i4.p1  ORF type:complete len:398 (+),score=109.17 TRINITY_DN4879_c0_g1_i4:187-1380(+)
MSFREIRNFTEIMRALGYPRPISMENFRTPNFVLVADILYWLVQRYDPSLELSDDIETEADRVRFIKEIVQVVVVRTRLRLNPRKLYQADGHAVQEMLKLASLLHKAITTEPIDLDLDVASGFGQLSQSQDLKTARQLASEITNRGANLAELLGKEKKLRDARTRAIARPLDLDAMERLIKESIQQVIEETNSVTTAMSNISSDEVNLEQKIEKRKGELERNQKRLKNLQGVRPSFMDEYEKMEVDLQNLYALYLERFRNLDYLEHEVHQYQQMEQERLEEAERAMKRMQLKIKEEEMRILRGEAEVNPEDVDDMEKTTFARDGDKAADAGSRRQKLGGGRRDQGRVGGQVFGSMNAGSDGGSADGSDAESNGEICDSSSRNLATASSLPSLMSTNM